jgi:peptidoglycan/LPS O-acetylase OafA/YrhL
MQAYFKNNFDFLRLFAATAVLLAHQFALVGIYVAPPIPGHSWAGLAVSIFFVISGYLVSTSWRKDPILWRFLVKRLLRLIPALAFVTILTVFVIGPLATSYSINEYFLNKDTYSYLKNIYLNMHSALPGVFLNNPYPVAVNASIWTLPLEVNWYEVLAVLGLLGWLRKRMLIFFLICICIIWDHNFHLPDNETNLNWFFHYGAFFLSGVMSSLFRITPRILYGAVILSVIAFYYDLWFMGVILVLPVAVIYIGCMTTPVIANLDKIGDISYGVYLFAFPIQQTVIYFFGTQLSFFALIMTSIMVTYLLAYISWKFVEEPALGLKKYFGKG